MTSLIMTYNTQSGDGMDALLLVVNKTFHRGYDESNSNTQTIEYTGYSHDETNTNTSDDSPPITTTIDIVKTILRTSNANAMRILDNEDITIGEIVPMIFLFTTQAWQGATDLTSASAPYFDPLKSNQRRLLNRNSTIFEELTKGQVGKILSNFNKPISFSKFMHKQDDNTLLDTPLNIALSSGYNAFIYKHVTDILDTEFNIFSFTEGEVNMYSIFSIMADKAGLKTTSENLDFSDDSIGDKITDLLKYVWDKIPDQNQIKKELDSFITNYESRVLSSDTTRKELMVIKEANKQLSEIFKKHAKGKNTYTLRNENNTKKVYKIPITLRALLLGESNLPSWKLTKKGIFSNIQDMIVSKMEETLADKTKTAGVLSFNHVKSFRDSLGTINRLDKMQKILTSMLNDDKSPVNKILNNAIKATEKKHGSKPQQEHLLTAVNPVNITPTADHPGKTPSVNSTGEYVYTRQGRIELLRDILTGVLKSKTTTNSADILKNIISTVTDALDPNSFDFTNDGKHIISSLICVFMEHAPKVVMATLSYFTLKAFSERSETHPDKISGEFQIEENRWLSNIHTGAIGGCIILYAVQHLAVQFLHNTTGDYNFLETATTELSGGGLVGGTGADWISHEGIDYYNTVCSTLTGLETNVFAVGTIGIHAWMAVFKERKLKIGRKIHNNPVIIAVLFALYYATRTAAYNRFLSRLL
jgi:hypothetical protein